MKFIVAISLRFLGFLSATSGYLKKCCNVVICVGLLI